MTFGPFQRTLGLLLTAALFPVFAAEKSVIVVVNSGDGTASIFAPALITNNDPTLKLLRVLPVGKTPNEVCISPSGTRAYVGNRGDVSVTVLDLEQLTVAATISDPEFKSPDGCLVSADGKKLYVAAAGAGSVFVFSTADHKKLAQIKVGEEPRRLVFSPDGSKLYVSNGEERYVSVVDVKTEKEVAKIRAGRDNRGMIITPDKKYLAITNVSDDTVQFVKLGETDTEFVVGVPRSPQRLLAIPGKDLMFAIGRFDNVLSILDLRATKAFGRFLYTMPVGKGPWGMALSAAGDCVYVTNTADNTISVIDLRLMRPGIALPTGKGPLGVAVH